jgi:hypothetical protein
MVASSDEELSDLEEEVVAVRARKSLSQVKKHRVVVDTSDEELPDLAEEEEEVAVRAMKSLPSRRGWWPDLTRSSWMLMIPWRAVLKISAHRTNTWLVPLW